MKHPQVPLGEVADFVNGAAFKPEDWGEDGLPIIRIQNLTDPRKPFNYTERMVAGKLVVDPGDLLVSWSATLGVFQWNGPKGLLNQHIFRVLPNNEVVDKNYLRHALGKAINDMERHIHGATMKHVNRGEFLGTRIPLPPLEEQQRIAAILDKAAELNNLSKAADELLTDLRATRLRQLLSGEVSNLSKFQYVPLSDLICGKPNNGIFRKNPEYQDPDSGGLPVVWVEQLFRGEVLELSSCKKLDATNTEIAKYGLKSGDILFCRSSLKLEGIAKPNIYVGADDQALFECHLIRISPDPAKINPIFLNECLNLPEIRAEARRLSKTSTMTTIDQDGILGITVPLPPLHIQEQFAQEFAHFQCLLARRRKSNRAIGLVSASLASLQLCETRAS
jgi:type I restriction enzyme S subunit